MALQGPAIFWMAFLMICSKNHTKKVKAMANTVVLKNGDFFTLADMPSELTAQAPKGGKVRFMLEETGDEWLADFEPAQREMCLTALDASVLLYDRYLDPRE